MPSNLWEFTVTQSFRFMRAIAFSTLSLSSMASASPSSFHLSIAHYPFQVGVCDQAATQLAARLTQVTGATVTEARCESASMQGADISITYVADGPLHIVSTFDSEQWNPQGAYETAADCQADRTAQWQLFKSATGIDPIAAYCIRERGDNLSNHPYVNHCADDLVQTQVGVR